ncbi:MAG TPA: hypothetical protein PLA83_02620 [Deltaproteobacteria bacterium]|jgi:hypothetical protein|nr:hypothetical protein [Deltaproteobacteria bacterium]HQI02641.1 hypothetical protein [Deltaproteobacteria bacterium]
MILISKIAFLLLMIGMFILPQTGFAGKTALSDDALSEIVGRTGPADGETTSQKSHVESMTVLKGLLTLSGVDFEGSITCHGPDSSTVEIDHLYIDAIRPGSGTAGSSFGSFLIQGATINSRGSFTTIKP